jgi:diadenosine tetraphosphatase ApaH/serine/threonine PP2A family protein phosphatase
MIVSDMHALALSQYVLLTTTTTSLLPSTLLLGTLLLLQVFVVHGGLVSTDGATLDEIERIQRNHEPPDSGLMSDLMWSDPQPFIGRTPSKRGVGMAFGPDVTKAFLDNNGLELLVRYAARNTDLRRHYLTLVQCLIS